MNKKGENYMISIPEKVINEIKNYRNKVSDYEKGNLDGFRFKPYRVSMGIYEQRDLETYMVRTRIPSGIITLAQLKKISELADKYGNGYIHFTTRQDIQFHGITLKNTVHILEELLEVGIITRGTGGNTPRNVTCSPLSGVSKDEVFDVTEYAAKTTSHFLKDPTALNLPRKYKIAFSNSPADTGYATVADLGFIAKIKDNQKGFEVYGAGGLGGSPTTGLKLEDFIPANEILYYAQAMKEMFENEGDRTNKHKARIRFIRYRLGDDEFIKRYKEYVKKVKEERDLRLNIDETIKDSHITNEDTLEIKNNLIIEQKNKGFYSVYIQPDKGNLTTGNLNKLIKFIDDLSYEVSLRVANTQGIFVRDLKAKDAEKLLKVIEEFTYGFDIDNSIACAGAATCKLGLCLSQNLLSAIKQKFKTVEPKIKSQLPRIFISGCSNSCGQHQIGKIGLAGKAKRTENGLIPMYTIHFGGNLESNNAVLGEAYGDIPAKKVPKFLYELAKLKEQSGYNTFIEFLKKEGNSIEGLIEKFANIETVKEETDLYYDFGSEERFSLKGRGPGECSAGVLDVIKLDLSNAETELQEYDKSKESIKLYNSSLSAARALLILKGVDTTKDRIIFKEFIKHFVETGYVKSNIEEYLGNLIDYKIGDLESLDDYYDNARYLVQRVRDMYDSLSPKLEITLEKESDKNKNPVEEDKKEVEISKTIDLRGVKCPINFVKAKIEMSKITSGEEIGFLLDDGEPIDNVPRSLEGEGHQILDIDTNYEGYNLLTVKKK
ncbi:MAG: hypothetical protein PWQ37_693 [Candidatus Petromonas sp.]|jgi:sulfite reductase (ferredoxin)|nr:hypothetical protein [Candidatus Petromonas sp.]